MLLFKYVIRTLTVCENHLMLGVGFEHTFLGILDFIQSLPVMKSVQSCFPTPFLKGAV